MLSIAWGHLLQSFILNKTGFTATYVIRNIKLASGLTEEKYILKRSKINYSFHKYHTVCSRQMLYFVNIQMQDRNRSPVGPREHCLQGFAPSATISMRSEERLMSRWSRWATNAQCMSLDFTQATFAAMKNGKITNIAYKSYALSYQLVLLILTIKYTFVFSWSLPLYWQTFCIHESGFTFIKEYGILITCIMFMTLWNQVR